MKQPVLKTPRKVKSEYGIQLKKTKEVKKIKPMKKPKAKKKV
jgi:hypothetical protein